MYIEVINITSNWIQRADQRSIISFTGGRSITIVCFRMANVVHHFINRMKISLCLLYFLNNSLSNTLQDSLHVESWAEARLSIL